MRTSGFRRTRATLVVAAGVLALGSCRGGDTTAPAASKLGSFYGSAITIRPSRGGGYVDVYPDRAHVFGNGEEIDFKFVGTTDDVCRVDFIKRPGEVRPSNIGWGNGTRTVRRAILVNGYSEIQVLYKVTCWYRSERETIVDASIMVYAY